MKEFFKIIGKHFILLFGTGLFIYGLFSLKAGHYGALVGSNMAVYHYYNGTSLGLLSIGVVLIVIGILKIKRKGF